MPQEIIEQVNQLGIADGQPELLTFYDRKGRLIRETETPGPVPNIVVTTIPDDEDGLEDLNPPIPSTMTIDPTISADCQDYGTT